MCCESHNLCFTTIGPVSDQRKAGYGLFFRETRNAVRTVRTVRYIYPRVMLPQLPPWTGGCHIMPTHAGKGSTPRGLLSDLLVRVQHPTSLSRHLRNAQFRGDTSRSHLPQGARKLPVASRGCVLFMLTPGEVVDRCAGTHWVSCQWAPRLAICCIDSCKVSLP